MSLKNNVKHIFFDLDHTLWDFDKNSGLAFKRLFKSFNIPLGLEEFLEVYEPINLDYWRLYRNDKVTKQALRRGRLKDAFAAFGMTYDVAILDAMGVAYIDELPKDNHLFDYAMELLDYLQKDYILHIITNGFEEVQHKKLKNANIASFFTTVTTSEDAGVKKPNPYIFKLALERSGATPEQSVMIGDSFEADVLGARAQGFHTIFFNYRNQNIPNSGVTVQDLEAISCFL
ncbi:MAG: YjjG family noncanonical pyrimidine nucleotidase [Gilvibacter sp.]|uniref:YjjG family noncanonical pyrimidine nucleotidase n=1 Tax=Nonlabens ulvanivorans TaxID=906888 RepID=UPI00329870FE